MIKLNYSKGRHRTNFSVKGTLSPGTKWFLISACIVGIAFWGLVDPGGAGRALEAVLLLM